MWVNKNLNKSFKKVFVGADKNVLFTCFLFKALRE